MNAGEERRCRNVLCKGIGDSAVSFSLSGHEWRLVLWGKRLFREGEVLAEGVRNLSDAVLWAMAWEACLENTRMLERMQKKAREDYIGRANMLWLEWSNSEGEGQ